MPHPQIMPKISAAIRVAAAKIACDGEAASGHPRVYLNVAATGSITCPYCGKHYVLTENAHGGGH